MISSILIPQEEDMGHSKEQKEKKMTAIKLKSKKNLGPDILGLNCEHASEDYKSFLEHLNSSRTWTSKKQRVFFLYVCSRDCLLVSKLVRVVSVFGRSYSGYIYDSLWGYGANIRSICDVYFCDQNGRFCQGRSQQGCCTPLHSVCQQIDHI